MKGYKGCSCRSGRTERRYDEREGYTTKQKWVAGLACNFFQYDHSLMNNVMKIMNTLNR